MASSSSSLSSRSFKELSGAISRASGDFEMPAGFRFTGAEGDEILRLLANNANITSIATRTFQLGTGDVKTLLSSSSLTELSVRVKSLSTADCDAILHSRNLTALEVYLRRVTDPDWIPDIARDLFLAVRGRAQPMYLVFKGGGIVEKLRLYEFVQMSIDQVPHGCIVDREVELCAVPGFGPSDGAGDRTWPHVRAIRCTESQFEPSDVEALLGLRSLERLVVNRSNFPAPLSSFANLRSLALSDVHAKNWCCGELSSLRIESLTVDDCDRQTFQWALELPSLTNLDLKLAAAQDEDLAAVTRAVSDRAKKLHICKLRLESGSRDVLELARCTEDIEVELKDYRAEDVAIILQVSNLRHFYFRRGYGGMRNTVLEAICAANRSSSLRSFGIGAVRLSDLARCRVERVLWRDKALVPRDVLDRSWRLAQWARVISLIAFTRANRDHPLRASMLFGLADAITRYLE